MSASEPFPVTTRQAARSIAGFPTEILLQIFDDKTLVLVTQGKIGRMLQVTPPSSSNTRRRTRDIYNDELEEDENVSAHPSLASTSLPPPDPSSSITTLFGSSKSDTINQVEHLYAAQIAAILFSSKGEEGDSPVLMAGKPVVVGLGLKPAFLEDSSEGDMHSTRERFKEIMELVWTAVKGNYAHQI